MRRRSRLLSYLNLIATLLVALGSFFGTSYLLVEWLTPGPPETASIRSTGPRQSSEITLPDGPHHLIQSDLLTNKYRLLRAQLILPGSEGRGPMPLVVVSTTFLTPKQTLPLLGALGHNAVLLYSPPDMADIRYDFWSLPPDSSTLRVWWEEFRHNPIYRWLAMHRLLHQSPRDIVRLVQWAREQAAIDSSRISIIGLGMGTLAASSAALGLQKSGTPVNSLVLVFPTTDIAATIRANYLPFPGRNELAELSAHMLRRLDLGRSLPGVVGRKLLVIPVEELTLPTYASDPAIDLAVAPKTVKRIDLNYKSWNSLHFTTAIRDEVHRWLLAQKAISGY